MNEQDKAVAAFLAEKGIVFTVYGGNETKRDEWVCDEWRTTFSRDGKDSLETPYYTGIGHRKSKYPMPLDIAKLGKNILARVEWEKQYLKPVPPTAGCVLHNILLDAQSADQSFYDWCSDLGYDTDSRKAEGIYYACCDVRSKVYAFFTADERKTLSELLEGY